jgi:hypothetical protein
LEAGGGDYEQIGSDVKENMPVMVLVLAILFHQILLLPGVCIRRTSSDGH